MTRTLTAILVREGDGFVALCPEIDVVSQGDTVEEAKNNLREAVELFFECASEVEIQDRLRTEAFVSPLEVEIA
ncbi:MAG: type II toxin-antitoxin system HicB family antitoxin [Verrucomicrobia bacterium]|nr:MAG: type II toxin-antitoxin system HicB family antitoxin [Verrucomicrobiota bacterium]